MSKSLKVVNERIVQERGRGSIGSVKVATSTQTEGWGGGKEKGGLKSNSYW